MLIFTDQEKQQASIKMFEVVLERIRLANSEGSVRSITRRVIAVMFTGVFLLMLVAAAGLYPWFEEWATHIFKCSMVLKNAIIAIIIFYFGSYGLGYILEKKGKK
ncbi:unnamed protein product [marine sediment metagenome]|uniref:Uncharacterized protein n=1 Tax=marine sediment metagenome TaxID=412755 RepID=X0WVZ4_9ZZZZ